jgi:hypothetical protein
MPTVESRIKFLASCVGKPVFHERRRDLDNLPLEEHTVRIEDARAQAGEFSLDREGFALVPHRSRVGDFFDQAALLDTYRQEVEELIRAVTGASKAVASTGPTGGVIRRSERSSGHGRDRTTVPGRYAHCDFSPAPAGSRQWVERMLPPAEAQARLDRRFAIYTVWRALSPPPQDSPLAVCDFRSVGPGDRVGTDCRIDSLEGPQLSYENSTYRYNPAQHWFYFPRMTRDEVLIMKGFDSDLGRAGGVPHAAFDDPSAPADAPPRESIDVRVFAFFESEAQVACNSESTASAVRCQE